MEPIRIFVSYNHDDHEPWFVEEDAHSVVPWLRDALVRLNADVWWDRDEDGIRGGDDWQRKIEERILSSHIALLMVSQAFLNPGTSQKPAFIHAVELPLIERRALAGEMDVLPVLLEPCTWKEIAFIARWQMVPGGPVPFSSFLPKERLADFKQVRHDVHTELRRLVGERRGRLQESQKQQAAVEPQVTGPNAKPRLLCGRAVTDLYGDPVGGVDVRIDPPGVVAQTDEHGSFTAELAREQYTDAGQSVTLVVPGYRPLSVQLQFDEELLLSLTPDDWPECPECGQGNRPENSYCWHCGCALREQTLAASSADATQITCSECGSRYGADVCPTFCQQCGSRLKGEQAAPPLPPD